MARVNEYTADEASRMYLERLKQSNPSAVVQAVIREIEDEIQRQKPAARVRRKHRQKGSGSRVTAAR